MYQRSGNRGQAIPAYGEKSGEGQEILAAHCEAPSRQGDLRSQ